MSEQPKMNRLGRAVKNSRTNDWKLFVLHILSKNTAEAIS